MEDKEIQPMIHMKNSSIVIVKNSASIIFGLFFILYSSQSHFVNRNALNVRNVRRKKRKKNNKKRMAAAILFSIINYEL